MKFRKKVMMIEAVQMPTNVGDMTRAPDWLKDAMKSGTVTYTDSHTFTVMTLDGLKEGSAGDFIMQRSQGDLCPCKREVFVELYERAPTGVPLLGS